MGFNMGGLSFAASIKRAAQSSQRPSTRCSAGTSELGSVTPILCMFPQAMILGDYCRALKRANGLNRAGHSRG